MRLYTSGRAPNPRRVSLFLAEKNYAIADVVDIDMAKKEHKGADFTRLNPFQRMPVLLLDDGSVISESVTICRYIEEALAPEPNLLGRDAKERAIIDMWNRRVELNLLLQVASVFRHLHPSMAELETPQIAAWGEANRPKVLESCAIIDQHLAHNACLAGERFSIADITAFVALDFLRVMAMKPYETMAHLNRWRNDMAARPAFAAKK